MDVIKVHHDSASTEEENDDQQSYLRVSCSSLANEEVDEEHRHWSSPRTTKAQLISCSSPTSPSSFPLKHTRRRDNVTWDDCSSIEHFPDIEGWPYTQDNKNVTRRRYADSVKGDDEHDNPQELENEIDNGSLTDWTYWSHQSAATATTTTTTTTVRTPTLWDDDNNVEPIKTTKALESPTDISPTFALSTSSCLDCIDDFLQLGFFGGTTSWMEERSRKQDPQIVVKVLATTVSPRKEVDLEHNQSLEVVDVEDQLFVSNFVGIVHKNDPRSKPAQHIKENALVTSIRRCGTRARFVTVPSQSLIQLPETLDPGEAVSLVAYYLPAFEALHHGRYPRESRYSQFSLKNKQVFITGGHTLEAQATVKLAVSAGATRVFLLNSYIKTYYSSSTSCSSSCGSSVSSSYTRQNDASRKQRTSYRGDRVVMLHEDDPWLSMVRGCMDIVIDYDFPKHFDTISASVARNGRLVCQAPSPSGVNQNFNSSPSWSKAARQNQIASSQFANLHQLSTVYMMPNAFLFDFTTLCDNNYKDLEEDLRFLIRLLEERKIRPNVDKYTKRKHIPIVQEQMEKYGLTGAVICEPWRG